ncbi:hypothetical protein [Nocardioides albertanoniae]|uniref:hypothetical protein n=1 Tax=Nocardioides albertanoniae TaxID=1175486 RepID=UPI0011546A05|nr:hypothetical protein [Nocardioides albertanoniae]
MRAEAGGEATELRSDHGFWIVRAERSGDVSLSSTYWIAHPTSARTLVLDATIFPNARDRMSTYDSLAATMSWKDADPFSGQ